MKRFITLSSPSICEHEFHDFCNSNGSAFTGINAQEKQSITGKLIDMKSNQICALCQCGPDQGIRFRTCWRHNKR